MDPISKMNALFVKCRAAHVFKERLAIIIEVFKYALENEFIDAISTKNKKSIIKFYMTTIAKQAELRNELDTKIGDDIDEFMILCDRINAKYSQLLSACIDNDV